MKWINRCTAMASIASVFTGFVLSISPVAAAGNDDLARLLSDKSPAEFATVEDAVAGFKEAVQSENLDRMADILGLKPELLKDSDGIADTLALIKVGISRRIGLETQGDYHVIEVGEILWPFPFPVAKMEDGKFAFDPVLGIEEIVNRRVGENEIQTIETIRSYIDAQEEYASADHDGDGVLEYAQKIVSSPGEKDGLLWPDVDGDDPSPASPLLDFSQLDQSAVDGYFGYRYKVLTRQGDNIAGGAFDYTINGNMIAGYALVAWPVKYGETGVNTFVVNRNGIVYQADLGAETNKIAPSIKQFNPDDRWSIVDD
ncbi:DUF2950 family protein [Brucella cytisi]|nr:DUF2950 family protein [Brucella cytisi]